MDLENYARRFFADLPITDDEAIDVAEFLEYPTTKFPVEIRVEFPKMKLTAILVFMVAKDGKKTMGARFERDVG